MNLFIMIAILVANIVAVLLIYQFIKKLQKMDKIIFIAGSFAIIYILVLLIYWISGIGIDKSINESAKDFVTFLFVPVNIILLVPFVASKYSKYKLNQIGKKELLERIIKVCLVALVLLTIECIYFRHIKQNIETLNSFIMQNNQQIENKENDVINNNTNTIMTNEITNTVNVNQITNTTNVNEVVNTINKDTNSNNSNVVTNTIKTNSIR